ncbi:hypothetical protein F4803DRAFT_549349 [Xylaria telfairii]|nr:hypothetical protein F4803DRAFT_549349 [Xylaria telfairii]
MSTNPNSSGRAPVPSFDAATMGLQTSYSLAAQPHLAGPAYQQSSQNVLAAQQNPAGPADQQPSEDALPAASSVGMPGPKRILIPTIQSFDEAFRRQQELIATKNVTTNTSLTGMPVNNIQRQILVQRLWDALFNLDDVMETSNSQHWKYIADPLTSKMVREGKTQAEKHYPDEVVEAMAWTLLSRIEDAQRGVCHVPFWFSTDGPSYKAYPSFDERFHDVETGLRDSKACCCSIFSVGDFAARLAWNPEREIKRKGTNRVLNGIKNNIQTVGNQVIHEEDVKMSDAGVLVGVLSGKKYPGKKKLQAEQSSSANKSGGVNKRTAPGSKSELARRFSMPAVREKLEQELAQADKGRTKSLGAQGSTPLSKGPQTSLNLAANTAPALPIHTSATSQATQMGQPSWNALGPQVNMSPRFVPMGTPVFPGQQALQQQRQQPMFIGTSGFQGQQAMQQQLALPGLPVSQHLQMAQPYQAFRQPLAYEVQQTLSQDNAFQQQPALQPMSISQHLQALQQAPQQAPQQDQSFQQPLAYEVQQTLPQDHALQQPSHPQEQPAAFLCPQPLPDNEASPIGLNYNIANETVPQSNDEQNNVYSAMPGDVVNWADSPDGGLGGLAQHKTTDQNRLASNTPVEDQEPNTPVEEQEEVIPDQPPVTDNLDFGEWNEEIHKQNGLDFNDGFWQDLQGY